MAASGSALKRSRNVHGAVAEVKPKFVGASAKQSSAFAWQVRVASPRGKFAWQVRVAMLRPMPMPTLQLVHADATFLIVNKPAGLLSVPGLGKAGGDNLAAQVQAEFADALVVHRLDMATSGLMVFARGAAAQRQLSIAFAERRVHKRYVAICEGVLEGLREGQLDGDSGSIHAPLIADWPNRPRQIVDRDKGKAATTHWRVLQRLTDATRLDLQPVTGRSHQLRVHLQFIGHPIRGDALYAPLPLLSTRLMLHATHLAFAHPSRGTAMAFDNTPEF
jgi:tRNA pseudouridine32 synthase / 23S rRNA pseudouridine746 synthase